MRQKIIRRRQLTAKEILDPYYVRNNGSYKLDMPDRAYGLALLGLTDRQIAMGLGVDMQVFNSWKTTKPDFAEMLERGKTLADAEVAKSLYKCATGYTFVRQYVTIWKKTGEITKTDVVEHSHPNPFAAFKWLQIRQKGYWNPVNKIEADFNVVMKKEDLENFSDSELETMEKLGLRQLAENI